VARGEVERKSTRQRRAEHVGTVGPALAGGEVTESDTGTLGPSVRAVVPLRRALDGPVVALAGERLVVVGQAPASAHGRSLGTVVTLRDRTELAALTNELGTVRSIAAALHRQAHEAANRLHTVVHADRARGRAGGAGVRVVARRAHPGAHRRALRQHRGTRSRGPAAGQDGGGAGALDRPGGQRRHLPADPQAVPEDLLTIVGNLVDNAFDAVRARPPPREVNVRVVEDETRLLVEVRDNGAGRRRSASRAAGRRTACRRGWRSRPGCARSTACAGTTARCRRSSSRPRSRCPG
jgi:two-component system, CitB family, sensor kinase